MPVKWIVALYGAVLLAVAATLCGQYLLLTRFEDRLLDRLASRSATGKGDSAASRSPAAPFATAARRDTGSPSADRDEAEHDAPAKLAVPDDASPILTGPGGPKHGIRSIIDSELPHATPEQRNVWASELRGMPPHMIRDLLRLRGRIDQSPAPEQ